MINLKRVCIITDKVSDGDPSEVIIREMLKKQVELYQIDNGDGTYTIATEA